MNTLSLSPLFRRSVGFDRLGDWFETTLRSDAPNYPPYNIEKRGDNDYRITVAAAGFAESELDVSVDNRTLTISGSQPEDSVDDQPSYLHRGIARRSFKLSFRLDEHIEVQGARFEKGLLIVELLREVPQAQRARRIPLSGGAVRQSSSELSPDQSVTGASARDEVVA